MKVGDLVKLSAYGLKRKRATWIEPDDIGIVVKIRTWGNAQSQDYQIHWSKSNFKSMRASNRYKWEWEEYNQRKDLKYAKISPGSSAG